HHPEGERDTHPVDERGEGDLLAQTNHPREPGIAGSELEDLELVGDRLPGGAAEMGGHPAPGGLDGAVVLVRFRSPGEVVLDLLGPRREERQIGRELQYHVQGAREWRELGAWPGQVDEALAEDGGLTGHRCAPLDHGHAGQPVRPSLTHREGWGHEPGEYTARAGHLPARLHDVEGVDDSDGLAGLHQTHADVGEVRVVEHDPPEFIAIDDQGATPEGRAGAQLDVLDSNGADLEPHRQPPRSLSYATKASRGSHRMTTRPRRRKASSKAKHGMCSRSVVTTTKEIASQNDSR